MMTTTRPTIDDIEVAHERIRPYVHRTPIVTCSAIDEMVGGRVFFKCENFQKVGAFKIRGATNAVFSLSEDQVARGVVTHSSGNHAQALALAAKWRGTTAYIVMPSNAPMVKQNAVHGYGAKVTLCEPTLEARESTTEQIIRDTGAYLVHPYDDDRIIAGQGTCAAELLEDAGPLDFVLAPVGGGGLLSGTLIAVKETSPRTKVIAGEPAGADDAYRSVKAGEIIPSVDPDTIADGLLTSLGERTFPIISELVDDVVLVTDEEIISAMRTMFERTKLVIEPSAAVPVAALLTKKIAIHGGKAGVILSGGNVDLARLPFTK